MADRDGGEALLEPGPQALEVLLALRQHPGVHEDLPDNVQAPCPVRAGRGIVGYQSSPHWQAGHQPGGRTLPQPAEDGVPISVYEWIFSIAALLITGPMSVSSSHPGPSRICSTRETMCEASSS